MLNSKLKDPYYQTLQDERNAEIDRLIDYTPIRREGNKKFVSLECKEKKNRDFISLVKSERLADKKDEEEQELARANERLTRLGKEPVESLEDIPDDVEELDPFLDEAANFTFDMLNTGKYAINHN